MRSEVAQRAALGLSQPSLVTVPAPPPIPADPLELARKPIMAGTAVILAFFGGLGLWGATAPLRSAAIAPGVVTVDTNRKTVQHLEGGIVAKIHVREGSTVLAGDTLIDLDDTQAKARYDGVRGQYLAEKALEARLIAERDGKDIVFPPELEDETPSVVALRKAQENVYEARRSSVVSQIDVFKQRIQESKKRIVGLEAQHKAEDRQIALVREELAGVQELFAKGYERKTRVLSLQRTAADLEGSRGDYAGQIAALHQTIGETEMQIIELKTRTLNEAVGQLRDVQVQIADLEERQRAAKDQLDRTRIIAPQDGTVVNLKVHTTGGVIAAGEAVLDLVPKNDELVIDAQVRPEDIDVVQVGLPAEVRLTAFKTRKTPTISGEVTQISADRLTDQRSGQPYYQARVKVDAQALPTLGPDAKLVPGMPAQVMIVTGERTALHILLEPFLESLNRSFREE